MYTLLAVIMKHFKVMGKTYGSKSFCLVLTGYNLEMMGRVQKLLKRALAYENILTL